MAQKFLVSVDLNKNELQNAVIQNLGSAPPEPRSLGQVYFDTASGANEFKIWNGTTWVSFQPKDTELTALASVTSASDTLPYFTGSGSASTTSFTAGGRAIVGVTGTAGTFPYFSSANTVTSASITTAGLELLNDADASAQRTTLGLGTAATATLGLAATNALSASTIAKGDLLAGNASSAFEKLSITGASVGQVLTIDTSTATGLKWATPASGAMSTFVIGDGTNSASVSDGETIRFNGTTNEIEVVVADASPNTVTIGLPNDVTIAHDLTVGGALTVSGSLTYINVESLQVEDPIIHLATGNATETKDIGFVGEYLPSHGSVTYTGLAWDASDSKYRLFTTRDPATASVTVIHTEHPTYSAASLVAFYEGTWGGDTISIAKGGTGATSTSGAKTSLQFMTRHAVTVGDNTNTSFTVTHNFGTQDVVVEVYETTGSFERVFCDVAHTNVNAVTVSFAVAPTSVAPYRVVVIG